MGLRKPSRNYLGVVIYKEDNPDCPLCIPPEPKSQDFPICINPIVTTLFKGDGHGQWIMRCPADFKKCEVAKWANSPDRELVKKLLDRYAEGMYLRIKTSAGWQKLLGLLKQQQTDLYLKEILRYYGWYEILNPPQNVYMLFTNAHRKWDKQILEKQAMEQRREEQV